MVINSLYLIENKNENKRQSVWEIFSNRLGKDSDPVKRISVLNLPSINESIKVRKSTVDESIVSKSSIKDNKVGRSSVNE